MVVYRITLSKYAGKLSASGSAARWNSKDVSVIYTAGSRSLACLESLVHRRSKGLSDRYKIMTIEIPDHIKTETIIETNLTKGWEKFEKNSYTKSIGDKWIKEGKAVILRVPSVIIRGEYNYLINPAHKDFQKIKLIKKELFTFDERLK